MNLIIIIIDLIILPMLIIYYIVKNKETIRQSTKEIFKMITSKEFWKYVINLEWINRK